MNKLKIGWSEVDITPDKKVSLDGQFAERISEYVEKPLTATAMALDSGSDQAVICGVDLVGISYNLVTEIRRRLTGNGAGLDPMKVMLGAIHTHTGPCYVRSKRLNVEQSSITQGGVYAKSISDLLADRLPKGRKYVEFANISHNSEIATDEEVFELLAERLTRVILDAWNARSEGSFSNAFGRAAVGMCRRAVYSDGSAQMWGDTNTAVFTELESGNDSGIELLFVYNNKKELSGIVANIACPAQCVQHRLFVSPDYWGEVKVRLRARFGEKLFLLPLCSAAGCQCPVDLIRWVEPESDLHDPNIIRTRPLRRKADPSMFDIAGMRRVGKRIAREIIDIYEEGLDVPQEEPPLVHHVRNFQLPLRRVTLAECSEAEREIERYLNNTEGDVDFNDAAHLQRYLGILSRAELQETVNVIPVESHILRLGTVAIATNPFELFLNYGNQIRCRSLAEQTFLIQLCNGSEGYLPTEKAEQGGHYSGFVGSGQVGHEGGDQLVRDTLQDINSMF